MASNSSSSTYPAESDSSCSHDDQGSCDEYDFTKFRNEHWRPRQALLGTHRKLELYTQMYHACFLPATTQTLTSSGDLRCRRLSIVECVRKRAMLSKPVALLLEGVAQGLVEDLLEYGLRLSVGMSEDIPLDLELARKVFTAIVADDKFPAKEKVIAANCVIHLRRTYYFDDEDDEDRIAELLSLAEMSSEYGLFTHTCLQLAVWAGHYADEEPYSHFPDLWFAYEIFQEETGIQHPKSRKCAMCGLSPGSRTFLRKCGGKCPTEKKPVYCDQQCQKQDWPNHQKWCKAETRRERFVTEERCF